MSLIKNFKNSNLDIAILRFIIIIFLLVFSISNFLQIKFYNSMLIDLKINYSIATVQILSCIGIFVGYFKPKFGILGVIIGLITYIAIFIFYGINTFTLKNILLISSMLVIFKHDLNILQKDKNVIN